MAKKSVSILIFPILMLILFSIIVPHQGSAYYGGLMGGGIYGLGGLGLYGLGGLGSLYGLGGLSSLYGLGGLYGMGLYGLGGLGLYGIGGLSSLYGLGGLGGLYGMGLYGLGGLSSLYGLGGLYGMGLGGLGLYGIGGLSSLYGLGGLGGLYGMNGLAQNFLGTGYLLQALGLLKTSTPSTPTATTQALLPLAPFSPLSLSPLPSLPLPLAGIAGTTLLPLYLAEQTGTWVGQWIAVDSTASGILAGPMTLDIVEDPFIAGAVSGFAVLELNAFLGAGVSLNGTASNNLVTLQGSVATSFGPKPLTVDIICTLSSATHMTGTYQIADYIGGNVKIYEVGQFDLELLPTFI